MIKSQKLFNLSKRGLSTRSTAKLGDAKDPIVFIEGVRTPFLVALTDFQFMLPHQLLAAAFKGLLERTGVAAGEIDYLCAGTVQQEVATSNVAKEAAFEAGLPKNIPGHTVTMACISANQAVDTCVGLLATDRASLCVAGGVDFCSDQQIRFPRPVRQLMLKAGRAKTPAAKLEVAELARAAFGRPAASLAPEMFDPREFTTGEIMGQFCDRLCEKFAVSREQQDEFGLRSHQLAATARSEGKLSDVVPVLVPESLVGPSQTVGADNGIRGEATKEKLAKLRPAFSKTGTVTAANASFLSDGASACLLARESTALRLGLRPKAYIRGSIFVSADPKEELLLGPAYATAKILQKSGLQLADFDVFEIHEAFSGQVLANMAALDSAKFCEDQLRLGQPVGLIPLERTNLWGGSVSLGHPFGATGVRLLSHAANRLEQEGGQLALVTACAANAQGVATIIEKYPN